jgi:hypothetical protein
VTAPGGKAGAGGSRATAPTVTATVAAKPWRPCCGVCRMTTLSRPAPDADVVCLECGAVWDGSEVSRDKLPPILEQAIAAGLCTRDDAFDGFLRLDDLAEAAAREEITFEQGHELVVLDALRASGKERAQ